MNVSVCESDRATASGARTQRGVSNVRLRLVGISAREKSMELGSSVYQVLDADSSAVRLCASCISSSVLTHPVPGTWKEIALRDAMCDSARAV
eukprot:3114836-Rhodomonas_salina.1